MDHLASDQCARSTFCFNGNWLETSHFEPKAACKRHLKLGLEATEAGDELAGDHGRPEHAEHVAHHC